MKHSILAALALLTMSGGAGAAPGSAPFGCNARPDQVCYFKLLLGPRATRIVQLRGGMKVTIPGLDIGQDHYCVDLGKSPAHKCRQKTVNASYND
jgi:hypothetical protein